MGTYDTIGGVVRSGSVCGAPKFIPPSKCPICGRFWRPPICRYCGYTVR